MERLYNHTATRPPSMSSPPWKNKVCVCRNFNAVLSFERSILGHQVIGVSHLAKIITNCVDLSTYHNIYIGFSSLWPDINTEKYHEVNQCLKFMYYHSGCTYCHAIVSIYCNEPIIDWNGNKPSMLFYNKLLSFKSVIFKTPTNAFNFVYEHRYEVTRVHHFIRSLRSPFQKSRDNTVIPFYSELLHNFAGNTIDIHVISASQLLWIQKSIKEACIYGLSRVFNYILSTGVLSILDQSCLDQCLNDTCYLCYQSHNKSSRLSIIKTLISLGASLPSLHIAFDNGFVEAAKLLVKEGADLTDVTTGDSNTVLHLACTGMYFPDNEYFFNFLIGLDKISEIINQPNATGQTPLLWAIENYEQDYTFNICLQLINVGLADVNVCDNFGDTALSIATRNEYTEIIELLLESGAEPLLKKCKTV